MGVNSSPGSEIAIRPSASTLPSEWAGEVSTVHHPKAPARACWLHGSHFSQPWHHRHAMPPAGSGSVAVRRVEKRARGRHVSGDEAGDLHELRDRVRVLAAGLGLADTFGILSEVRHHADAGRNVDAVRELPRQTPGRLGLVAAERMIDHLQR